MRSIRQLRVVLVLLWLVTAAGCYKGKAGTVNALPEPAPKAFEPAVQEPIRQSPPWDVFYLLGSSGEIRRSIHPETSIRGEQVQVSTDSRLLAVLRQGTVSVMDLDGAHPTAVGQDVRKFLWRPGTHDLLYLDGTPNRGQFEWRLRHEDGTELPLIRGSLLEMIWASVAPSGNWLAYQKPGGEPELVVASLNDASQRSVARNSAGFLPFRWAGVDTLAIVEGRRTAVTIDLPTGKRTELLQGQSDLVRNQSWLAAKGLGAIAESSRLLIVANGRIVSTCGGEWDPLGWSSDGQYLAAVMQAQNASGEVAYVLAAKGDGKCMAYSLSESARWFKGWHPAFNAALFVTKGPPSDLQVWVMQPDGPVLSQTFAGGTDAAWVDAGTP